MKIALRALCCGAAFIASGATAANYQIGDLAVPTMTYGTAAQAAASVVTGSAYNGVGTLFISVASTATTGFGFICTGSLINSTTVVTAAHCLYDYDESTGLADPVVGVNFYLPSLGAPAATRTTYAATSWEYNPDYDTVNPDGTHEGDIGSGHDVGIFTLGTEATGHDTYQLYTGDNPLGAYTEVGTGTIGNMTGTGSIAADYLKRTGNNLFELYGDDVFSDVTHGVVLSDFDDGTAAHDVFGNLNTLDPDDYAASLHQTGVLGGDADSSPGDSGGPEFNADGQIISVTSFGITGAVLQGFCGGAGAIDPYHYNAAGTAIQSTRTTNLSLCTNSSVGEIAGDTLVSYNLGFINSYLDEHPAVPEPATWAMMIAGFGMVGGSLRARRSRQSLAQAS